jgi:hypothetical protein
MNYVYVVVYRNKKDEQDMKVFKSSSVAYDFAKKQKVNMFFREIDKTE